MTRRFRDSFRRALTCVCAALIPLGVAPSTTTFRGNAVASGSHSTAAPTSPDWASEARRSISEREYEATDAGLGLQAPNRAAGLRTYFEPSGARVLARDDATELALLETVGVGRAEPRPVSPGEVVADGARVEVRRPGVVEWYENSERGLEQGWTFAERPDGEGPLAIEVDFGDATARVDGDRAVLIAPDGRRLDYGGLDARDARGTRLDARMEAVGDDQLRIVVDDGGAEYPVTVDPMLTSPAFATLISGQTDAAFGQSVASAGDVNGDGFDDVVVGAPNYDLGQIDEGAAFVFLGGPNGIASGTPATASAVVHADQASASLGHGVASAGDVNDDGYSDIVVGAPFYDGDGFTDEGAAFVFLGSASGIHGGTPATASAVLQSDQTGAQFGFSVAGAGDVDGDGFGDVVVGAPHYSNAQSQEGAAIVFLGGPSGIASGTPATASTVMRSNQFGALLGYTVAGAGDVNHDGYSDVIAGAIFYTAVLINEGAAFVLLGGPSGIPSGTVAIASALLRSDQIGAQFGWSVASAGDVDDDGFSDVIVGARSYSTGGLEASGAAFVFMGSASGIPSGTPATARSVVDCAQQGGEVGFSVAGAGDINGDGYSDVVVGARRFDSGQPSEGIVLGFFGGPAGIPSGNPLTAAILIQVDQAEAELGFSVAGAGDVDDDGFSDVVVAAPSYDGGSTDDGAAFVYRGSRDGLSGFPAASAVVESNQVNAGLGFSVAGAGDVNNDGYADIIVGAYLYDLGQTNEGAAFVFLGGPSGIRSGDPSTASALLQSDQANAVLGFSVAGAGDVNDDGYDDVIVGAPAYISSPSNHGAAFVFLGSASGIGNGSPANADATLLSDHATGQLGSSVAGAGDVDDDGYDDVIVGAPGYEFPQIGEGAAFVFFGSPTGIGNGTPANANATLQSDQPDAHLGNSVAGAGDTNGDGYDDVIVGAFGFDAGQADEGAAFVYLGGPTGIGNGTPANADAILQADQASTAFGVSAASAGDVNHDGYADVIVGASRYDSGQTDEGAAFVYLGGPAGIQSGNPGTAATVLQSDQANGAFGSSVTGAGDVDDDGFDDVVVGAVLYDSAQTDEGAAWVFLGGPSGIPNGSPSTANTFLHANQAASNFGVSVAAAGDTNGDGFDDVVAGAPGYSHGETAEGGAFLYNVRRPALAPSGTDTVAVYVPASGAWFLKNANAPGGADVVFTYGAGGGGLVALRGDWDGDGDDTPGLYNPANGAFFLRNASSPGGADVVFTFGAGGAGYIPMVGDWNGDGDDTVGLYSPTTSVFFLRNENSPGGADAAFGFGAAGAGWLPISGDWNGDGTDTIGLYVPATSSFFLRNANASGAADVVFGFGPPASGWTPIVGDFDGDRDDTVGLYNASTGLFFLRNRNAAGAADATFGYGPPNANPLVGDWDGN